MGENTRSRCWAALVTAAALLAGAAGCASGSAPAGRPGAAGRPAGACVEVPAFVAPERTA